MHQPLAPRPECKLVCKVLPRVVQPQTSRVEPEQISAMDGGPTTPRLRRLWLLTRHIVARRSATTSFAGGTGDLGEVFCNMRRIKEIVSIAVLTTKRISIGVGMGDERNDDGNLDVKGSCPPNTTCVPISMCPLLGDLMDYSCFSSDKYFHRLNELTCGQLNGEDYVCCPSCDCGKVYQDGTERCGRSMVQGVGYKGLGAHPWVARIGFTQKESGVVRFACSGSIVSKQVVLTAAHCALAKPEGYKLSTVVVGEWDTAHSPDCSPLFCAPTTQAIKVENVVVHPGYEQKIFRHDIALIVLKEDIKYSVSVAPICLNEKPEVVINERALLVGWGKLSGQNNVVSRQQQLEVPLVPLATCERIFGDSVPVHEGQLCAGGEEGRDACSGFGGAPLLLNRDGQYYQVGIVSFGSENCGSEGVPSVYTNIAHYYKWVIENSPSGS